MSACNIGEAAARSGVSAKMIRHYEEVGLVPKARRTGSGYRTYADADVHRLRFIRQIGDLLALWQNRRRESSVVRKLALAHIADLDARIAETQAMKATLEELVRGCHGDARPHCPILVKLAEAKERSAGEAA